MELLVLLFYYVLQYVSHILSDLSTRRGQSFLHQLVTPLASGPQRTWLAHMGCPVRCDEVVLCGALRNCICLYTQYFHHESGNTGLLLADIPLRSEDSMAIDHSVLISLRMDSNTCT